jgi:protein-tyrosine phosphatase
VRPRRAGRPQQAPITADPRDHVEAWIVDKEDANNDLAYVIRDAAHAVKELRDEGKTVFLHCVHAHTRTPVVAAAYGALVTGDSTAESLRRVLDVLPSAYPRPSIRRVLEDLHL